MGTEIQRVIDSILKEIPNAHAFINDFLVLSKGTKIEHIAIVEKILRKLDRENNALQLPKCDFSGGSPGKK